MADGSSAGQGTLTKGARITGDQRTSLAQSFGERYAGGESIRSIAQESGRSYGFVHGVLKESGASLRGRGGATRGPRRTDGAPATTDAASAVETKAKAAKKAVDKKVKAAKDEKPKKKADAKKASKKGKKG